MRRLSILEFTLGCSLSAALVATALARATTQFVTGRVVAAADAKPGSGIPNVRVSCVGPDGAVHDDVRLVTTDGQGLFGVQVPAKYATFSLLFVDAVNHYWPKQMELSPSKNPLQLQPIQLHPQTLKLSAAERLEVEKIQQTLTGFDPLAARTVLAQLEPVGSGHQFVATGAGPSSPLFTAMTAAYLESGGQGLSFQSVGSGAGIKQIKGRTLTFGVTEHPFSPIELQESGLVQWPVAVGGQAIVVHVGVHQTGVIVIDGPTLANIYLGKIRVWDDPAIAALNPKLLLPHLAITPVHRADAGGATATVTEYLASVSGEWNQSVGQGAAVKWPGGIAAKGNEGVAAVIADTDGALGYVDYTFASQARLTAADMVNADGKVVSPNATTLTAAMANTPFDFTKGFGQSSVNAKGAESWPLTSATYAVMQAKGQKPGEAKAALGFFNWTIEKGPSATGDLHAPALPDNLTAAIRKSWVETIRDDQGHQIWK